MRNEHYRGKAVLSIIAQPENFSVTKGDLDSFLKYCDKDLYLDMRDRQITIPQFKARVSERYFGIKFVVLDDLKAELDQTTTKLRSKSSGNAPIVQQDKNSFTDAA